MKILKYTLALILVSNMSFSQDSGGGEFKDPNTNGQCLTNSQRETIINNLKQSQNNLATQNRLLPTSKSITNPLFIWPVKKSNSMAYDENWVISNYVDHNTSFPNQITDYNGGTKSYDTSSGYNHQGIDISTWPYKWKTVDDNGLEVIAAAPGQIIYKSDGQFDRNCALNNSLWNAVYIKHSDGSVAWYGHLKNGSLTTKNIGSTVTAGEYLGVVASSGNSTGPHLHLEVFEDDTYTYDKLIDPYAGPSNNWNATSWWQNQKPYRNPKINALTTNTNPPNLNLSNCPTSEVTNETNLVEINTSIYFIVFLKDQIGHSYNMKVYRPNNTVAYSWDRNLPDDYPLSYWWHQGSVDTVGLWKVECILSTGDVVNHTFSVQNSLSVTENSLEDVSIFPNPANNDLFINSKSKIKNIYIRDVFGKVIYQNNTVNIENYKVSMSKYSNGLYFLTVIDKFDKSQTIKLIKE